jgi:hypothetical protein
MNQRTIIRKTVDFIIENEYIPHIKQIDPEVMLSPISIIEYINIDNKELPNFKLFFTDKLDIAFLQNKLNEKPLFIDDSNDNTNLEYREEYEVEEYQLSDNEYNIISRQLINNNSICNKMNDTILQLEYDIYKDDDLILSTDIDFRLLNGQ